jgi:hypothetical protein
VAHVRESHPLTIGYSKNASDAVRFDRAKSAQRLPDRAISPVWSDPRTCTVTDDDLFAAIARNDRDALGALYDRHSRIVFALALHVIGDRQRSEDLLHDLFLDLVHRARAHDRIGQPLRWLVTQVFERTRPTSEGHGTTGG